MQRLLALALAVCACASHGEDVAGGADAAIGGAADARVADAAHPILPPPDLSRWLVGNPADAVATPTAGVILMGGGPDVDEAFAWQRERIDGGDVVVLRTSGEDGYNEYLFSDIGGVDSVETLRVDTRALADDPYVAQALAGAEAIFMAGGDQATYVETWTGTGVQTQLARAWKRGAVLGGTSAGCAVLGEFVFAARNGSMSSDEGLEDPFNEYMTLERAFVVVPPLAGIVTDTHFRQRDRMGRLFAFAARIVADGWSSATVGLGVDEATALVVDETGHGTVLGDGDVHVVQPLGPPDVARPGQALRWIDVPVAHLRAGDEIQLPAGATDVAFELVTASDGALTPSAPY